ALIATVYFARINRQARPAASGQSDSPIATTAQSPTADPLPAPPPVKSAKLLPADDLDGDAAAAKISAASHTGSAASDADSKVELHAPTIPQLAAEPPASEKQSDEGLFKFSKKSEPRIAVRPDTPATIVNPLVTPRPASSGDATGTLASPYLPPSA